MKYAVCEISGRQYLVEPGRVIEVDKLAEAKTLSVDKVLLLVSEDRVEVGQPYLKQSLDFEVVATVKKPKIRVATYHAKANYRRVKGMRAQKTQIKLKAARADTEGKPKAKVARAVKKS
ncbi:50S ribosomal protein L21 [Candidatus Daviesbacteria bacterium]|nr:50S ribosomal protein L21 [Candidatus Daviesbacteria bacterium]